VNLLNKIYNIEQKLDGLFLSVKRDTKYLYQTMSEQGSTILTPLRKKKQKTQNNIITAD